jgi:dimethylargininase
MHFRHAIVRPPGSNFAGGLSTGSYGLPDLTLALEQHTRYCNALETCGLLLTILEPDQRFPDSTFVEDTAVLLKECAVLAHPGAESRRGEVEAIRGAIEKTFGQVEAILPPGTMDGGDICEAGNHFFIGISGRTNEAGARQLAEILTRQGCTSDFVDIRRVPGILHLKSGLASLGDGNLVVIEALAHSAAFQGYHMLNVDPAEDYAANCVRINDFVLLPAGYPRLRASLDGLGYRVLLLEMSEFQKMDGGLSCLSLRF